MDEKPEEHLAFQFAPLYASLQQALEAIFERARSQRVIFVIDEFPYLAKADPSVSSILQALIDRASADSKLLLLLCGSSLSFMKEQVLGEKSPLYGRRTAQIELKPFDFFTAMELFPQRNPIASSRNIRGMVGGVPLYLMQFQNGGTLRELTEAALLDPNSILYEEPSILLMQEVSKASRYNAVIDAIANGRTQSGEIATAIGSTTAETSYYLKELERIGLVTREQPPWGKGQEADLQTQRQSLPFSGFDSSHRILPRSNVGCQDVLGALSKRHFPNTWDRFSKISATSGFGARWQETSRP